MADHVEVNRRHWNDMADQWVAGGERAWADEVTWGMWQVPEEELHLLPEDMTGMGAIELGCGTGYVSSWLARRGAAVTGIDISEGQLATAARLADEHGVDLTLIHGSAEEVPLPDGSFDFAISEYGAVLWCDPDRWLPEARRLLRPGGRLVFLTNHPIAHVASPWDGSNLARELVRPYFSAGRRDWTEVEVDPGGIDFCLTIGEWFHRLTDLGFTVEAIHEIQAPEGDTDEVQFFVDRGWAHDFPSELVMVARLA
jgi:SAM-dependent methyltransferase